ncbi:MAG: glycosyltransferase family 4 protein, partial [bacterium]
MRLAYLTTAYPEVSHTFIRREIQELERRGHSLLRIAVRAGSSALVDPRDLAEKPRTVCLLERPFAVVRATLAALLSRPVRFARALAASRRMSRASDRGLVRHLAYLAEACLAREILTQNGVEHVHVHFGTNAAAVGRLAWILGGPAYSLTVHGPDEFDAPIGLSLGAKVADSRFTVAISDFCAAQLRRWVAPEHWRKLAVVHCTIGDEFEKPATRIPASSKSFVCVGRLSAQKGQLFLLDAFAELVRAGHDAELVLAGDGELRPEIERRIAADDLRGRVRLTGWVTAEQVRELLQQARALVLPSFAEGLPVVIMESLALARPVITTFVAAIPELVEPGRSG